LHDRLQGGLLRLRRCGSFRLIRASADVAIRPFIAVLTLADSASSYLHEVVLGRIWHTMEPAVRTSKPTQTHTRAIVLAIIQLLVAELALCRARIAGYCAWAAFIRALLAVFKPHACVVIVRHAHRPHARQVGRTGHTVSSPVGGVERATATARVVCPAIALNVAV